MIEVRYWGSLLHLDACRLPGTAERWGDGGFRFGRYIRCDLDAWVAHRLRRIERSLSGRLGWWSDGCALESLLARFGYPKLGWGLVSPGAEAPT